MTSTDGSGTEGGSNDSTEVSGEASGQDP